VADGELVALVGPNGAGKTTLLRMLATLHRPQTGLLTVFGHELPSRVDQVRAKIGYLGHDPLVYLDLTPWQNLRLFADLYGVDWNRSAIEDLLDRVGLLPRAYDVVRTFSRGMVQRLGVARMLLHDPQLLLLDEPYAGLDAPGATLLDAVIAEGRTAVIVTHDVNWAAHHATRMMVLRGGRVVDTLVVADATDPDAIVSRYRELVA
jgi:heme exporter protein A